MRRILQSLRNIVLGVAVGIPLLLYPSLYVFQDHLLFHPVPIDAGQLAETRRVFPGAEVELRAADGTRLHGWLRRAEGPSPLLIYFGGNAEEVSRLLPEQAQVPGWSLLLINYRGYGLSAGKPGEKVLYSDALEIYDHFARRPEFTGTALMGRSLGTGVAVYLASRRPVAAVVLVSPYDSIRAVAQGVYPYVPVGWLLQHPFDSLARAPALKTPLLALIAERDQIIPPSHAQALIAAWGGPVQVRRYPDADHNSIGGEADYWPDIAGFLNLHRTATPGAPDESARP